MSSIAYISDHHMIEFHRLHGNKNVVFWRPSSQKKFSDFHYGDLLFFLTKGTERGKEREKGIVGYGHYQKESVKTIYDVWKTYQSMTGYHNEEQFIHAINRVCKMDEPPEKIHCLLLDNVIFFQTPIYLSEINQRVSKQVESYIYLDQNDEETTWQVLQKARELGSDMWSTLVEHRSYSISQDADLVIMKHTCEKMKTELYSPYEKKRMQQFNKVQMKKNFGNLIAEGSEEFYVIENDRICIYLPCILSLQTWKRNLLHCIGKYTIYQNVIRQKQCNCCISILFDHSMEEAQRLCLQANIIYTIASKA